MTSGLVLTTTIRKLRIRKSLDPDLQQSEDHEQDLVHVQVHALVQRATEETPHGQGHAPDLRQSQVLGGVADAILGKSSSSLKKVA